MLGIPPRHLTLPEIEQQLHAIANHPRLDILPSAPSKLFFKGTILTNDVRPADVGDTDVCFTDRQKRRLDLMGKPLSYRHRNKNSPIGVILDAYMHTGDGRVFITGMIDRSRSALAHQAADEIESGAIGSLSLMHGVIKGTDVRTVVEVSVTPNPRVPGANIKVVMAENPRYIQRVIFL